MTEQKNQAQHASNQKSDPKGHGRRTFIKFPPKGDAETKKKDPDAVPILRYGPSNNFMLFKEALSKKALVEFGNLGKLIRLGYIPLPEQPDRDAYALDDDEDGLNKLDYMEDMKQYRKEVAKFREDGPKLYGVILKYLSDESLDAIQKEPGWPAVEADANPETLWQLVEMKHKVHSASEVEVVVKLAARSQLAACKQGGYESIVAFKQRYTNALKAYQDQKNPVMSDPDIAMDFFSKLDNGRYAEFKTAYLNNLQMKAVDPPENLNEIYLLASTHLKPKVALGGGIGSTFATMSDTVEKRQPGEEGGRRKRNGKNKDQRQTAGDGQNSVNSGAEESAPKKRNVKCFNCGEEHYINHCPEFLQFKKAKEEESKLAAATWDASTFTTYQVNAIGVNGFKPTEVLLDNQANISIMRPELLRAFEKTEQTVRITGVGGMQLCTNETGYLEDFFRVYCSRNTKANVLSFSDVEDVYPITYQPQESFTVHFNS